MPDDLSLFLERLDSPGFPQDPGPERVLPRSPQEEFVHTSLGLRQAGADPFTLSFVKRFRVACERNLYVFAKGVLGLTQLTDHLHEPICRRLTTCPPFRQAIVIPRDCLKTSMLKAACAHALIQPAHRNLYFPFGIFGHPFYAGCETRVLYAGETALNAKQQVSWIRAHFETNQVLRDLWPEHTWPNPKRDAPQWSLDGFTIPRKGIYAEPSIYPVGVGTAVTGRHFTFHALDDIATLEAASSPIVMEATIEWFKLTRPLFDDARHGRELNVGTRWAAWDPFQYYLDEEPYDPATGRGVAVYTRAAIEDGIPIFPEKLPMDVLREKEASLQEKFPLLYLSDPSAPTIADFPRSLGREFQTEGEGPDRRFIYADDPRDKILEQRLQGPSQKPLPPGIPLNGDTYDLVFSGDRARAGVMIQ